MPEEIVMPRLSDTMQEGTIARWLKQEGDPVKTGEALMEVETDKATLELQAYQNGTLAKIIIGDGGTAPIGTIVGILAKPGEEVDLSKYEGQDQVAPSKDTEQATVAAAPVAQPVPPREAGAAQARDEQAAPPATSRAEGGAPAPAQARGEAPAAGAAAVDGAGVKASPLARVMAEEAGIDLRTLAGRGSGPGGRIVRQDVEAAVERGVAPAAAAPVERAAPYEDVELNRVRQAIVRNLAISKPGAPHIYLTIEVEMDEALALYRQLNELVDDDASRITLNDLVLKATALALRKYPNLNAHFLDEKPPRLRVFNQINLTVAVPGPQGLMVPVIKDVDRKTLGQIAREAKEIYGRIRASKPQADDFSGGTFAVSNLGRWGLDEFQAVINPPQVGILAIGAAAPKAVVRDGEIVARSIMRATLSSDHRAADGDYAADFLVELKRLLERPLSLML